MHRRQSAWHWALSGGLIGAYDYHQGNASMVNDFLKNVEYKKLQTESKRGDWRYLLRYIPPTQISFVTYAMGAGLLARFAGVPW